MPKYVAFLRGMNIGGRRITNPELCACFEALGCEGVHAFLASGNVVFDASGAEAAVARRIERGLEEQLDYAVPTFLRSAAQVRAAAAHAPFEARTGRDARGKLQVVFLAKRPSAKATREALALESDDDWLAIEGRELYWSPIGRLIDSELDFKALEAALGSTTTRTNNTVSRLTVKHLSRG